MKRYLAVVIWVACFAAPVSARIVMIDDFDHESSVASLVVDETTDYSEDEDVGIPTEHVIGGVRMGYLEAEGSPFAGEIVTMELNTPSSPGTLVIRALDVEHRLTRGVLRKGWRAPSGSELNAKWNDLTAIEFLLDLPAALDQEIIVRLWSDAGGPNEQSPSVTETLHAGDSYASFSLVTFNGRGLDLDDVDAIEISFENIPGGQDLVIDQIRVVPEPATLALLTLGGLALMRRRRWKRQIEA